MFLAGANQPHDSAFRLYEALLAVTDCIAVHYQLSELFHDLAERLRPIIGFDTVYFVLHDADQHAMRSTMVDRRGVGNVCPIEAPVEDSPIEHVFTTQQACIFPDIADKERFGPAMEKLRRQGLRSVCVMPLTTAQRRLGALIFCSEQPNTCLTTDLEFLKSVCKQVAVAVESGLNREDAEKYQVKLAAERDRACLLLEINNLLVSKLELRELIVSISQCLSRLAPHEFCGLALHEPETGSMRLRALDFPVGNGLVHEGLSWPVESSPSGEAFTGRKHYVVDDLRSYPFASHVAHHFVDEGVQSACWIPLISQRAALGTFCLGSVRPAAFSSKDTDLLQDVSGQIAVAVENALAFQEIAELKNKVTQEKVYLEDEIRAEHNFENMVGDSPPWKGVMRQVQTVASSEATVLILGETGTGKELIARAIHSLSERRERRFVKLNCSAIPTGLLESELFGHEKGAFTGAISRKIGRFELADGGTLFLDEIGDIPLELQPKLLRALQDREFERLGSNRTLRVNVRVLAATNRNLVEMVAHRTFRRDLYYRLAVFPIFMPALRDRASDIPELVRYFMRKYAQRMDRKILHVPAEGLQALARWHWPGNIRELENLVERAVILSRGPILEIPLPELQAPNAAGTNSVSSLEETERRHILHVLRETGGVVGGPTGAAARLGLKRTTLNYKMKRLAIDPRQL
jgi:formate hydrogenlyase transcriptional activator